MKQNKDDNNDADYINELVNSFKFNEIEEPDGVIRPSKKPTAIPRNDAIKRILLKVGNSIIIMLIELFKRGIISEDDYTNAFSLADDFHEVITENFQTLYLAVEYNLLSKYEYKGQTYYLLNNKSVRTQFNALKKVTMAGSRLDKDMIWLTAFDSPLPNGCFPESYFKRLIECKNTMERIRHHDPFLMDYKNNHFIIGVVVSSEDDVAALIACKAEEIKGIHLPDELMFILTDEKPPTSNLELFDKSVASVVFADKGYFSVCEDGNWYNLKEFSSLLNRVRVSQHKKNKNDIELAKSSQDIQLVADSNNDISAQLSELERSNRDVKNSLLSHHNANDNIAFSIIRPKDTEEHIVTDAIQSALSYIRRMNNGIDGSRRQELLESIDVVKPQEQESIEVTTKEFSFDTLQTKELGKIPDKPYHRELVELLRESEEAIEEQKRILESFDSKFEEFFEMNEELEARLKKQQEEAKRLESIFMSEADKQVYFHMKQTISEFYPFEFHDFIIKSLQSYCCSLSDNKEKKLVEEVISVNPLKAESPAKELEESLESVAKGFQNSQEEGKRKSNASGFLVSSDGKHIKLCFRGIERYTFAVACTPSDVRASKNFEKLLKNKLLAARNL